MQKRQKDGRHDDRISPLNVQSGDFITLTGGGGKTFLLFALAEDLPADGLEPWAGALEALEASGADPSGFQGYAITHEDGRIKARPWGEK